MKQNLEINDYVERNVISTELEVMNRQKYGEKQFDVISDAYRVSKKHGDIWCGYNAIKYIKRYVGNSHKSDNLTDLEKAIDYLTRARDNHKQVIEVAKQLEIEIEKEFEKNKPIGKPKINYIVKKKSFNDVDEEDDDEGDDD
jgi:hypothetical protein